MMDGAIPPDGAQPESWAAIRRAWSTPKLSIPKPESVGMPGQCVVDTHWAACGMPVTQTQGWKLYVSTTLLNFMDVWHAVVPVFRDHGVPFKYIATEKTLRQVNAGLMGYSQVGKCIVGYLTDRIALDQVLPAVKAAVEPFRNACPDVPFAKPIGGGLPLYYRYGSYAGDTLVFSGTTRADTRTDAEVAVPEDVEDTLKPWCEPPVDTRALDGFLTRYPIFEAISQGGKGGVFVGFDLSRDTFTEVIVKVGYRNGQVLPDGRDGHDLLRHEADCLKMFGAAGLGALAPAVIDYVDFGRRNVLVLERLPGKDLMVLRALDKVDPAGIDACMSLMRTAHQAGFYLGDPKLANFVEDGVGGIRAIDFECAGRLDRPQYDLLRTFWPRNPEIEDLAVLDIVQFLLSVLQRPLSGAFSESSRLIDLTDMLETYVPESDVEAHALKLLGDTMA